MGVKRRGRRRDEDVLWAPENVGPPSWWWMTEETREVQADERDEDMLWAPEHILKVILLNSLELLSQCCVPPTGARPTLLCVSECVSKTEG